MLMKKSRIVPKIPRSPLCLLNIPFLVEVEGGFNKNKLGKSRVVQEKRRKNSESVENKYWWICIEKPNIRQKQNFKQSHSAENGKVRPFWTFATSILLQNVKTN